MDDGDIESAQQSNWERWTGDSGPFFRACAVVPFDTYSDTQLTISDRKRPEVEFTTGITRHMLRNLPTVIPFLLMAYIPLSILHFVSIGRIQTTLPDLTLRSFIFLVPGVIIAVLWLYLVYQIVTSSLHGSSIHRSVVFFATVIPLVIGTGHATYTAWMNAGTGVEPAVTVQAGYFLFVLITGHLVYDGLALRLENLFARLGTTSIVKQPAYNEFHEELTNVLGDNLDIGPVSLPRSVVFALVVALVPILLPVVASPWGVWAVLAYIPYSIVTLFVIAVLYDMFILLFKFTDLLRRDILEYRPFHPDEHGGFRDFGRFATRVNTILLVAGGYVVYRFYAEGILNLPSEGFSFSLVAITWAVIYVGPIVAYLFLVFFWLYHSFWRLHRKMEQGRQRRMEELQRKAREEYGDSSESFTDLDTDAPAWESLQGAPTWPIKRVSLFGMIVIDAIPVLLALVV